jgi:hypothetical protein
MKTIKRLIFLAVLLAFTACTDGPFAPWMDLTPPRGGWLWVAKNSSDSAIYKVDVSTGKHIDSLPAPVSSDSLGSNLDLAFGDGKLWVGWAERVGDDFDPDFEYYYCWIDPETGEYGPEVRLDYCPYGLAWDDPYLWLASSSNFYLIEPYTGEVVKALDNKVPGALFGLAWNGSEPYLLIRDYVHTVGDYVWVVCRIDPETGGVSERINVPLKDVAGLTFDGEAFWVNNSVDGIAYRLSPDTGAVLGYFAYDFAPCPRGLAWEFPDGTGN